MANAYDVQSSNSTLATSMEQLAEIGLGYADDTTQLLLLVPYFSKD